MIRGEASRESEPAAHGDAIGHTARDQFTSGSSPRDGKDPFVIEFLGLPESPKLVETGLEQALIDNLRAFLLELGKGFALAIKRFGGVDGYFKHCQSQDQARANRATSRTRKQAARAGRKTAKSS